MKVEINGHVDSLPCDDIVDFKETLKILRKVDDNVILELNGAVKTQSFKDEGSTTKRCEELFQMVSNGIPCMNI